MGMRRQPRDPGAAGAGGRRERPQRSGRRRLFVTAAQVALLAAFLGAWQLAAGASANNKFLYGSPTGIWNQLNTWVRTGTAEGPLWAQVWITVQETLLGFERVDTSRQLGEFPLFVVRQLLSWRRRPLG